MLQGLKISRDTLGADLVAGVVNAVTSIPDALGSAVLAGVNPVHGLYAITVGTPVGALSTSSVFMNISITSAMALAVGEALAGYSGEEQVQALITLTVLVGLVALVLGLLKLGTLAGLHAGFKPDQRGQWNLFAAGSGDVVVVQLLRVRPKIT